ncbi:MULTISPECIES: formate dehydrogenase accessory sulfurtransferase FdhD [Gordonibacter]|uniref:Formate dehydrogenase accessory sulfurtransferase FdhD n=1 Tax=Gordonibacter faecis TaxID=3047475 RepID=A0ABT7DIT7_9ACTN|nr:MULTISPECIES: formate dehydrogenase accessory sulfurtransferase FdhD [unclassified Gordonibacter]MDJ1649429.1 formate dehydrogenase accessory sulfurtransferase FdhD [Gordonibacter sp. KGMB12511]HIW75107.1 formate dehydrogenase accessory sulfurtransferase FdhD [Candidatus Gordonibacter avicola]
MARVEFCPPCSSETAERPIRIILNDTLVAVSQGSPYGLRELAVGYLLSEGLITDREQLVKVIEDAQGAAVHVTSCECVREGYVPLHRVTSAGCAQSAVLAAGNPARPASSLKPSITFNADALLSCMDELCTCSPRRNSGKCVHGCGLSAPGEAHLALVREDIGRHNALDKLIGQAWLDRINVRDKALFITGRISCEMALKAHRAGCPVLVSRKSATDEAVLRASELGVALVSHCRDGALRVLSCPERISN